MKEIPVFKIYTYKRTLFLADAMVTRINLYDLTIYNIFIKKILCTIFEVILIF